MTLATTNLFTGLNEDSRMVITVCGGEYRASGILTEAPTSPALQHSIVKEQEEVPL